MIFCLQQEIDNGMDKKVDEVNVQTNLNDSRDGVLLEEVGTFRVALWLKRSISLVHVMFCFVLFCFVFAVKMVRLIN